MYGPVYKILCWKLSKTSVSAYFEIADAIPIRLVKQRTTHATIHRNWLQGLQQSNLNRVARHYLTITNPRGIQRLQNFHTHLDRKQRTKQWGYLGKAQKLYRNPERERKKNVFFFRNRLGLDFNKMFRTFGIRPSAPTMLPQCQKATFVIRPPLVPALLVAPCLVRSWYRLFSVCGVLEWQLCPASFPSESLF